MITLLESELQAQGKIICSLKVNDLQLSESDEKKFSQTERDDISSIELGLAFKSSLVDDSLASMRTFCAQLKEEVIAQADNLRREEMTSFHHKFAKIINDTQLLSEGLMALKPHLKELHSDNAKKINWETAEKNLILALTELVEAYQIQDFVRVCDTLEYDLSNSISAWLEILPAV